MWWTAGWQGVSKIYRSANMGRFCGCRRTCLDYVRPHYVDGDIGYVCTAVTNCLSYADISSWLCLAQVSGDVNIVLICGVTACIRKYFPTVPCFLMASNDCTGPRMRLQGFGYSSLGPHVSVVDCFPYHFYLMQRSYLHTIHFARDPRRIQQLRSRKEIIVHVPKIHLGFAFIIFGTACN